MVEALPLTACFYWSCMALGSVCESSIELCIFCMIAHFQKYMDPPVCKHLGAISSSGSEKIMLPSCYKSGAFMNVLSFAWVVVASCSHAITFDVHDCDWRKTFFIPTLQKYETRCSPLSQKTGDVDIMGYEEILLDIAVCMSLFAERNNLRREHILPLCRLMSTVTWSRKFMGSYPQRISSSVADVALCMYCNPKERFTGVVKGGQRSQSQTQFWSAEEAEAAMALDFRHTRYTVASMH